MKHVHLYFFAQYYFCGGIVLSKREVKVPFTSHLAKASLVTSQTRTKKVILITLRSLTVVGKCEVKKVSNFSAELSYEGSNNTHTHTHTHTHTQIKIKSQVWMNEDGVLVASDILNSFPAFLTFNKTNF